MEPEVVGYRPLGLQALSIQRRSERPSTCPAAVSVWLMRPPGRLHDCNEMERCLS
jgi:hypothetical protein